MIMGRDYPGMSIQGRLKNAVERERSFEEKIIENFVNLDNDKNSQVWKIKGHQTELIKL